MKKALLIIIPILLVTALAVSFIILKPFDKSKEEDEGTQKIEIVPGRPELEIREKIEAAVIKDGFELYEQLAEEVKFDMYEKREKKPSNKADVRYVRVNDNYLIGYLCNGMATQLTYQRIPIGEYRLDSSLGIGYAVYLTAEDRLISLYEAYDNKILTDDDLDAIYNYQAKCYENNENSLLPFTLRHITKPKP